MTTFYFSLFLFAAGIAAGYRLFPAIARWRSKHRRKKFKPVLLRRYHPNQGNTDRHPS